MSNNFDFPQGNGNQFSPTPGAMEGDERLHVTFSKKAVLNGIKSKEEGRPIHEPVDFVRIQQPGERDYIERPAHQGDIGRFRRQWEAYQSNSGASATGTMLSVVFPNNPEIIENLKYLKIFTAEQMIGLNQTQIQNVGMGGLEFQRRCQEYMATAEKGKDYHGLAARIEAMELKGQEKDKRIADLEAALALKEADEPDKPRRGRPPNPVAA